MLYHHFFFAYSIGKVINGIFCKRYNIKWIIFFSLANSALINLIIAITTNFAIIKWLWLINGFVLSVLWPTLVRLLSKAMILAFIGLLITNILASILNGLITTVYPMLMQRTANTGLIAGILNGFCYLGSTISSYGLGCIAGSFGWIAVFWTLIIFCAIVCIIWFIYIYLRRIIRN